MRRGLEGEEEPIVQRDDGNLEESTQDTGMCEFEQLTGVGECLLST